MSVGAQLQAALRDIRRVEDICSTAVSELQRLDDKNSELRRVAELKEKEHVETVLHLQEENSKLRNVLRRQAETSTLARQEIDAVAQLRQESARWKERSEVLAARLRSVPLEYRPREWAVECPHEILLLIFRQCLVPGWLVRGGSRERPPSVGTVYANDLRTKASLPLVCKAWNQVATEVLYASVYLGSVGQLVAFGRSLELRGRLGWLVLRVDIGCFIPRGYYPPIRIRNAAHLLLSPDYRASCRLPSLGGTITSLDFGSLVDKTLLDGALATLHTQLLHLRLSLSEDTLTISRSLHFPLLEVLTVRIQDTSEQSILWDWTMPALRTMVIVAERFSDHEDDFQKWTPRLLRSFAQGITTLSLKPPGVGQLLLGDIPALCPQLQHLIIPARPETNTLEPPAVLVQAHPTVRFLDIWCQGHAKSPPPSNLNTPDLSVFRAGFPALETCRFLDATFAYLDMLPIECPPGLPAARGEIAVSNVDATNDELLAASTDVSRPHPTWMAIIDECVGPRAVNWNGDLDDIQINGVEEWQSDGDWQSETPEGSDDDGDASSSYVYESHSSDAESAAASDASNDDDALSELQTTEAGEPFSNSWEFHMDDEWEATREEVLEMFSGMLEESIP
ncbi:hypothetical protein MKEN_00719600 [Mycena kentingensis (nom. inval.)]|nr:hypothetical protein MKEN_00719600 [Mycena kentingensis (nom. inval.)]